MFPPLFVLIPLHDTCINGRAAGGAEWQRYCCTSAALPLCPSYPYTTDSRSGRPHDREVLTELRSQTDYVSGNTPSVPCPE